MTPSDSQGMLQPFNPPNYYARATARRIISQIEKRRRASRTHFDARRYAWDMFQRIGWRERIVEFFVPSRRRERARRFEEWIRLADEEENLWRADVLKCCHELLDTVDVERERMLALLLEATAYTIKPTILYSQPPAGESR